MKLKLRPILKPVVEVVKVLKPTVQVGPVKLSFGCK
jgi:hypothetical protein